MENTPTTENAPTTENNNISNVLNNGAEINKEPETNTAPETTTSNAEPQAAEPQENSLSDNNTANEKEPHWTDSYLKSIKDEKLRSKREEYVSRFKTPENALESLINAQAEIGRLNNALHNKKINNESSQEEIENYRKNNNIPKEAEGYEYATPEGMIIGDDDKDVINSFKEIAHDSNIPQEAFEKIVNFHYDNLQKQDALEREMFKQQSITASEILQKELKGDFDRSIEHLTSFLKNKFGDNKEIIDNAIGGDGVPLLSNPSVIRQLMNIANELDPVARVMPIGQRSVSSLNNEKLELESKMGTDEWLKNPKLATRLYEIYDAESKMKG